MRAPVKKEYITQPFGVNKEAYSKFGLQGHNGIDFRAFLPNGERCYEGGKSEVFAPHDGKIIENALDSNGYGWYIKIENDKEGSVLAHFSNQSPCAVGSTVSEGQFVGFQGTTGNSSGIHLHWGYYTKPRNRQNGYAGFINQAGLYQPWGESTMYKGLDLTNQESMKIAVDVWDEVVNKKLYAKLADIYTRYEVASLDELDAKIAGLKSRISDLTNQLSESKATEQTSLETISRREKELIKAGEDIKVLTDRLNEATQTIEQLSKDKANLVIEVEKLRIQIDTLKKQTSEGKVTITLGDLLKLLLNQKITITKG